MEMEISASHSPNSSSNYSSNVDIWNQWERASTTISQIDTTTTTTTKWESRWVAKCRLSASVFYFVFFYLYFNFYFNWNNIIPRSSHELNTTTSRKELLMEFVCLGLLDSWVPQFFSSSVLQFLKIRVVEFLGCLVSWAWQCNRHEGIVNYLIVYCGSPCGSALKRGLKTIKKLANTNRLWLQ